MRLKFILFALASAASALAVAGSAGAILGGAPDTAHPDVGLEDNGVFACSGTLISPRVIVTAAHCFSGSTSVYGGTPTAPRVEVTFDQQGFFADNPRFVMGTYHWDPQFCIGCSGGLPGFDTHDVAIIVLDKSVRLPAYGQLPSLGLVDTLPNGSTVDIVGYGVQHFGKPDPCDPNCQKTPDAFFTRFSGTANLSAANDTISSSFIKISGNTSQGKAATCYGDSGGPNFLGGTNILVAETSFGVNPFCGGVGYDYRLDTAQALGWINSAIRQFAR